MAGVFSAYANYVVISNAEKKVFTTIDVIPNNKAGLLLGTAKYLENGNINYYYLYRINAATELFFSGKIEIIIVSGDNSTRNYDEPTLMKMDLITNGIPENKIFLDYAGFRTLDSVVRCKEIFGQTNITIISQEFHNKRALFLANHFNINAIGYNAKDVSGKSGFLTTVREFLARSKMLLDIIFNVEPKFYGPKIDIQ